VTGDPGNWWYPFHLIPEIAGRLLILSIGVMSAWYLLSWFRSRRTRHWRSNESPFAGLEPFTADRASVFFGRDREISEVQQRLNSNGIPIHQRVIAIVGPSGSGKSSLVNAGVIPHLSPTKWTVVGPIKPSGQPFRNMAWALSNLIPGESAEPIWLSRQTKILREEGSKLFKSDTTSRPENLANLLRAARGSTSRLLLVIDQCEELFTLTAETERNAFLALLHAAVSTQPEVSLILTVRTDYRSAFRDTPWPSVINQPYPVTSLDASGLRKVITMPASAANMTFEDDLVNAMIADATGDGSLPLLSHLLRTLHTNAKQGHVTFEDYDQAGRVAGAITADADRVYEQLTDVHGAETVDRVLIDFLAWNQGTAVLREVPRHALPPEASRIVDVFRDSRLITDLRDGSTSVLAHDALLREWRTLERLTSQHQQQLRTRQSIEQRAQEWRDTGCSAHELLSGPSLVQAINSTPALTREASEFVEASRLAFIQDTTRDAERASDLARQTRFSDRGLALAIATAAVEQAPESVITTMTLWGLTAEPTSERIAAGHTDAITSLVWLDDEHIRTASKDGSVCTWNLAGELTEFTGAPILEDADNLLSPNGRLAAAIHPDEFKLCDIESGKTLGTGPWTVRSNTVAWSPDSQRFIDISRQQALIVSPVTDEPPRKFSIERAHQVQWSPDGKMIAVWGTDELSILDVRGSVLKKIHHQGIHDFAWSPCGGAITAITSLEKSSHYRLTVWDWQKDTERWVRESPGFKSMAWSPDGRYLVSSSIRDFRSNGDLTDHRALTVWNTRDGSIVANGGPSEAPEFLAWSPDGSRIATAIRQKTHVHSLDDLDQSQRCLPPTQKVSWSPDRSRMVGVGLSDHRLRIHGKAVDETVVAHHSQLLSAVSWSPIGDRIAAEYWDRENDVRWMGIHDSSDLRLLARLRGINFMTRDIAWSPDGRYLAIGTHDFYLTSPRINSVWDVHSGERLAVMTEEPAWIAEPLAWSPTGAILAGVSANGELRTWSPHTGELLGSIRIAGRQTPNVRLARCLEWSPDGSQLAMSIDNDILLFDMDRMLSVGCTEHSRPIEQIRWSPDSLCIASSAEDKTLRIWRSSDKRQLAVIDLPSSELHDDLWWAPDNSALSLATRDNRLHRWKLNHRKQTPDLVSSDERRLSDDERLRYGLAVPHIDPLLLRSHAQQLNEPEPAEAFTTDERPS